jgi:hypothetical protein
VVKVRGLNLSICEDQTLSYIVLPKWYAALKGQGHL